MDTNMQNDLYILAAKLIGKVFNKIEHIVK